MKMGLQEHIEYARERANGSFSNLRERDLYTLLTGLYEMADGVSTAIARYESFLSAIIPGSQVRIELEKSAKNDYKKDKKRVCELEREQLLPLEKLFTPVGLAPQQTGESSYRHETMVSAGGKVMGELHVYTPTTQANPSRDTIRFMAKVIADNLTIVRKIDELSHDDLTGLLRREIGMERIKILLETCAVTKTDNGIGILLADLDHFKLANDKYGHDFGDYVLTNSAQAMRKSLREEDIGLRYGGEELVFAFILKNQNEAMLVAQRCLKAVREVDYASRLAEKGIDTKHQQTASIGLTTYFGNDKKKEVAALIEEADLAMYAAKQGRFGVSDRDQVVSYDTRNQWK